MVYIDEWNTLICASWLQANNLLRLEGLLQYFLKSGHRLVLGSLKLVADVCVLLYEICSLILGLKSCHLLLHSREFLHTPTTLTRWDKESNIGVFSIRVRFLHMSLDEWLYTSSVRTSPFFSLWLHTTVIYTMISVPSYNFVTRLYCNHKCKLHSAAKLWLC